MTLAKTIPTKHRPHLERYAPKGHFVYILLRDDRSPSRFKIGRTSNPYVRVADLSGKSEFNENESLIVYVGDKASSVFVEKMMLIAFQPYRLVGETFAATTVGPAGRRASVFYAATNYVFENRTTLGDDGTWGVWTLAELRGQIPITPLSVIDE